MVVHFFSSVVWSYHVALFKVIVLIIGEGSKVFMLGALNFSKFSYANMISMYCMKNVVRM